MADRLRVLHLARPAAGGMRRHIYSLLQRTDSSCFQTFLAGPAESPLCSDAVRHGMVVFPVDVPAQANPVQAIRAAVRFRHAIGAVLPDVIHLHGWQSALVGRLAVASGGRRPKVVITAHNYVPDGPAARILFGTAERWLENTDTTTIAVSRALANDLVRRFGFEPSRVKVVYNGIDFADLPEAVVGSGSGFRVGTVSRLSPEKGVDTFIRSCARLKSVQGFVIGDGPRRGELEGLSRSLNAGVDFLGHLDKPFAEVAGWDAFVLSSRREAFGIALVEAMGQGVPAIGTRTGGIPEIIEDGRNGLLVPANEPEALATAISRIWEKPEEARAFARDGREDVRRRFSLDRMLLETQDIYLDSVG